VAEQQSHRRKKVLEDAAIQAHVRMATQPEGSSSSSAALLRRPFLVDPDLRAVKRAAATLLQHHQRKHDEHKKNKKHPQLPAARIHALQTTIRTSDWFARNGHHDDKIIKNSDAEAVLLRPLSDEILRAAMALVDEIPNPNYIGPAELVVGAIRDDHYDIAAFVKAWRTHFVETMDPRFLPTGWSVDAAVTSDVRTNDDDQQQQRHRQ
jgi:hypothetical protein